MAKVALVTGAGSGVGRSVAVALANEGYDVVLAGRRTEQLDETAKMLKKEIKSMLRRHRRDRPRVGAGAVRKRTRRRSAGSTCCSTTPASARPPIPLEDLTFEQWQAVVDVNLTGAFLCTQEAFRIMKDQDPRGGRIINNGSISAHAPRPNSAPYTATKHAITGLTKSTRSTAASTTSPAARSTSATPRPTMTARDDAGRAAGRRRRSRSSRRWTSTHVGKRGASTWPACRSTPTCCS